MRFWRNAAKDGAVLKNICTVVVQTRRPFHCGFWHSISVYLGVSNIDKVLQFNWQRFEEHPNRCAICISKDAGFMNVGWDVSRLIADF